MVNQKEATLVSDLRLTRNGRIVESSNGEVESGKAFALFRPDSRVLVGFTGLAEAGNFKTRKWLLETLCTLAKEKLSIEYLVQRLAEKATQDIGSLGISGKDRRLSIVLAGYQHDHDPPRGVLWLVSNFEIFEKHSTRRDGFFRSPLEAEARDQFDTTLEVESRPNTQRPCIVCSLGHCDALPDADLYALGRLVQDGKSRKAIINRAVKALRTAAENSTGQLIGRRCTSMSLPRDSKRPLDVAYHSEDESYVASTPGAVFADRPDGFIWVSDGLQVRSEHEGVPAPVTFGKVSRNSPCPCGSGVKFKKCHGA